MAAPRRFRKPAPVEFSTFRFLYRFSRTLEPERDYSDASNRQCYDDMVHICPGKTGSVRVTAC